MKVLVAIMFVFFPVFNAGIDNNSAIGKYYGNGQICHFNYVVDTHWKLVLNEDSRFVYSKSIYDSRGKDTLTNEVMGIWSLKDDSLLILKCLLKPKNVICPQESIVYKKVGSRLFTTFSCFDYFTESKQYLESLERSNQFVKSNFIEQ